MHDKGSSAQALRTSTTSLAAATATPNATAVEELRTKLSDSEGLVASQQKRINELETAVSKLLRQLSGAVI
jgi:hypothetical protein